MGISIIGVVTSVIISLFISNEKDISKIIADVENLSKIRGRVRGKSISHKKILQRAATQPQKSIKGSLR